MLRHRCTQCGAELATRDGPAVTCTTCGAVFKRYDGILSFASQYSDPALQAYFSKVATQSATGKSSYSAFSAPHLEWQMRIFSAALIQCLQRWLNDGALLLDVGCGHGTLLQPVAGKYRLVGIDFVPEMLDMARRRGYAVYHGDATALPFSDNQFDGIVCAEICNQIADIRPILAEAVRVCAPGGIIAVSTLNRSSLLRAAVGLAMQMLQPHRPMPPVTVLRQPTDIAAAATRLPVEIHEVAWILSPSGSVRFTPRLRSMFSPLATNFVVCLRKLR